MVEVSLHVLCEKLLLTFPAALHEEVDQQAEQVEIDIDFRVDDGQGELQFCLAPFHCTDSCPAETTTSDTSNLKRKRRDARDIPRTNDASSFINGSRKETSDSTRRRARDTHTPQDAEPHEMQNMDPEERERRAQELLQLAKEKAARKRLEGETRRSSGRRVTWVRKLHDKETAPVVPSRFEYYCQWLDRYRAQFDKMEAEDEAEKERIAKMREKMRGEGRGEEAWYYEQARSLEAAPSTSRRSKYNPRNNPDYAPTVPEPPYIPTFFRPMPKESEPKIEPHVPRHRQVQPVKSSILRRASRRVTDAAWSMGARAVGAVRSMVEGVANFVGNGGSTPTGVRNRGESRTPPRTSASDDETLVHGLQTRTLANETTTSGVVARTPQPIVAPPPPVEDEDEKSDTDERFYQPPPATAAFNDDDDEDDAFVQMSNQSRGAMVAEQRQKSAKSQGKAPAVVVHSTRNLDVAPAEPAALPEIGTGASRPITRDNTAFNAAGLDFVPLGIDEDDKSLDLLATPGRLISRLPSNATQAQREAAEANDRYHLQEARYALQQRQWQEYLRSLGSLGEQREVEPFRPGDSWRDDESDVELSPEESDESDDDGPANKRSRGPLGTRRRGRSRAKQRVEDQPDDKNHPRLKSPPPERRLPIMNDADEDEKADFDNTVGGRLRPILEQYDKRYEPEVVHSDDSDAENPDFAGIELDDDLENYIDDIEIPELAAAPLYGSGFNRDRVMPKIRRPDQDRERELERQRRTDRRNREADERRGNRWASGVPGRSSNGW